MIRPLTAGDKVWMRNRGFGERLLFAEDGARIKGGERATVVSFGELDHVELSVNGHGRVLCTIWDIGPEHERNQKKHEE